MKSILSKLWLGITGLVIIILIIIWFFQIFFLNNFYIKERTDILVNESKKIADLFNESQAFNKVNQDIINEIDSFSSSYNANIIIVNLKSKILYASDNSRFFIENKNYFLNIKDITRSLVQGKPVIKHRQVPRLNSTYITVGMPLLNNGRVVGIAFLNTPVQPIKEAITILRRQLTIITIISILVGTVLALLLAKIFTKPVLKINDTAKKIARGNFDAKVVIDSKDEIGILGNTINNLSTQLGQIEKFRREFIANTTHELKTPITLIKAYGELVKEDSSTDIDSRNEYLKIIIDESERLNEMVEDILCLSKMEAGYYKPKLTKFNIVDTIKEVLNKLTRFAAEKNINLDFQYNHDIVLITADDDKIQHVLLNLINNAIIHSHSNEKILINMKDTNDSTLIEVIDYGVGIPKEDLPHIWDRFYKVDKSRKRTSTGTGLGMAIVKNILNSHEFKYGIKSEINKGTNVWFKIHKSNN